MPFLLVLLPHPLPPTPRPQLPGDTFGWYGPEQHNTTAGSGGRASPVDHLPDTQRTQGGRGEGKQLGTLVYIVPSRHENKRG